MPGADRYDAVPLDVIGTHGDFRRFQGGVAEGLAVNLFAAPIDEGDRAWNFFPRDRPANLAPDFPFHFS
jgi:hypothetical protein